MKVYIYPQNLKASASIWFWNLRDFVILAIAALISVVMLVELRWMLPAALTLCFAFLTIRYDDTAVIDFIKYAARFFITVQQHYEWR